LASELAAKQSDMMTKLPAEFVEAAGTALQKLRASDIAARSLQVGATVPDFTLPNVKGVDVSLYSLLESGSVVLTFYRGGWCPYCNLAVRALQKTLPEIKAAGATLVAVSPQTPDASMSTAEKNELEFDVLSDKGNAVAEKFGIVFALDEKLRPMYKGFGLDLPEANGDDSFKLPLPATYVIDQNKKIRFAFADEDYTKRAEPSDIVDALTQINSDGVGELTAQLNAVKLNFYQSAPEEVTSAIQEASKQVDPVAMVAKALRVGAKAPDFTLPNASGKDVTLSELLKDGPVVLSFYRGAWCPFCNLELAQLQKLLPAFKEAGASLVAVSPQTPDNTLSTVEKNNLEFDVLSDLGSRTADKFGLVFSLHESFRPVYEKLGVDLEKSNGEKTYKLPVPATYVINKAGEITYAHVDADYTVRAETRDVLDAVKQL